MSTLLNKFLLLVSYNIITYELYILLYRLFGISSEGLRGSAVQGVRFRFSASSAGDPLVLVRLALFRFCGFSVCGVQLLPGSDQRVRIVPGVPSAVASASCAVRHRWRVSASAPGIGGGFRDNAGFPWVFCGFLPWLSTCPRS